MKNNIDTEALQDLIITFNLSRKDCKFSFCESISEIGTDWEKAQLRDNIFLQRSYLRILEENPPLGMSFGYLIFYRKNIPIGVAYCQVTHFRPDASIKDVETKEKYPCIIRAMSRFLKSMVASQFDHNLLVCGNLLLTGERGFSFQTDELDNIMFLNLLEEALVKVQNHLEKSGIGIDAIFIKDVSEAFKMSGKLLVDKAFREFTFHPNMILDIPAEWKTFDDYMAAISSKYRVRAKRAFRLAAHLEQRELMSDQIRIYKNRLFDLYKAVMDTASFNMVVLHENYLIALKEQLGDKFRVFGYFMHGELMAYRTTFSNGKELEAHFLGFDQEVNRQSQIYLNILFDILKQGIEEKAESIVYSRTAMEIKSSVGAKDFQMYCYIRANNKLTNAVLPRLLEYLRPPDNWVPRNPFR
jgi:hypothetical protein